MMFHEYIAADMESPDVLQSSFGQVAVVSKPCPGAKRENEDCAVILPINHNKLVLMVADGVGGHANGGVASSFITQLLQDAVSEEARQAASLRETILSTIEKTNLTLLKKDTGEATTVAIVEINNNILRSYHVGDSEVLVTGLRGKIKLQTVPHSPVGYAVEAGLIAEDDAIMHTDRHYVSNIVGQHNMHISISSPIKLDRKDTVLLGTDGVFDNLYKDEIVEIIRKDVIESAAEKMLQSVQNRMQTNNSNEPSKPDDMTFILYRSKAD